MKIFNLPVRAGQNLQRQQVRRLPSLAACIIFDLIGYASYSIPFFGEIIDMIWAPISGVLFFMMFGGWKGAMGGMFSFIEELLPGTDFIPSFTLMWLLRRGKQ